MTLEFDDFALRVAYETGFDGYVFANDWAKLQEYARNLFAEAAKIAAVPVAHFVQTSPEGEPPVYEQVAPQFVRELDVMPLYSPAAVAALRFELEMANGFLFERDQEIARLKATSATFAIGDRVRKTKGGQWRGRVVGQYSTQLTPEGYAVESEMEPGSVQIYPVAALEPWDDQ